MGAAALHHYRAEADAAVRELADRIEGTVSKPISALSYNELITINDLAVNCGSALLRLRASVFAEKRKHEVEKKQAALSHEREVVEIKRMAAEQMEIAARDFKAATDVVKRKAQEDYDDLCKLYNQKRLDFERMHVPMKGVPSFSEKIGVAGEMGRNFHQALSEWMSYAAIPSPNVPLYGWSYAGASVVLGFLMGNLFAGFIVGLAVPVSLYLLFIKAQLKLQELWPALERDRARIVGRMEDPIGAASKRLNERRSAINSTLTSELERIAEKQAKDAERLKSIHESTMAELKHTITSVDAKMLSLFSRLTKFEAEWQAYNRQSTLAFSEKPLDWEVPAPKIMRLGTLSLTERGLVQLASS